jgi:opacity protein-like surface antigen
MIPFGPSGPRPLWGALEVGLEPFYQRYTHPVDAFFAGLGLALRYHFLSLGRVVPYVEVFGAAGGTDLETLEIDSNFTFLLHAGVGLSVFVTDRTAVYAGYRLQHVSNGNTAEPNRGFESNVGVVGVSYFFR